LIMLKNICGPSRQGDQYLGPMHRWAEPLLHYRFSDTVLSKTTQRKNATIKTHARSCKVCNNIKDGILKTLFFLNIPSI
jgi:hypothetical protein